MKEIKVVELFAGVGGFRVGLERASDIYKFIWANQWEPSKKIQHAYDCYVKNFGENKNHINVDLAKVIDDIPDHDLLVGGFPCQDYSVASTKAEGIQGKKGVLWWEIDKILEKKSPKFVLLENVDRLLKSPSTQRGRDFAIMLKCFQNKGYDVDWMVINAADYGHVQKRRRVFMFAQKSNEKLENINESELLHKHFFTKKFKVELKTKIVEIDLNEYIDILDISDKYDKGKFSTIGKMRKGIVVSADYTAKYNSKTKILKDILENNVHDKYYINDKQVTLAKYTKSSKKKERITPDGFKYNYSEGAMDFPDNINKPARTMLTSEGTLNRSTHYIEDEKGIRILTPIETERINGFPDNWTNTEMPEKFRYFCMGNALVVDLVQDLGKNLFDYLNEIKNN